MTSRPSLMRKVVAYTPYQGAKWQTWPFPDFPLSDIVLELITEENNKDASDQKVAISFFNLNVHSILFEFGHRWDCVNGFTLTHPEDEHDYEEPEVEYYIRIFCERCGARRLNKQGHCFYVDCPISIEAESLVA